MPGAISPWEITAASETTITTHTTRSPALADDPAVRAVTVIGLIAVGIVHALEIPGQVSGAVWLTIGFCLIAVVAPAAGLWLLIRPSLLAWELAGLVSGLAAAGYVLTRSVPVPGDAGDVGNWLEPLGVAALITEGVIVIIAVLILGGIYRASHASRPWVRARALAPARP
jgi:hypothetical protein